MATASNSQPRQIDAPMGAALKLAARVLYADRCVLCVQTVRRDIWGMPLYGPSIPQSEMVLDVIRKRSPPS